jgi:hypothetical protein
VIDPSEATYFPQAFQMTIQFCSLQLFTFAVSLFQAGAPLLDKMDGKYVVDIMFQSILGLQFIIAFQNFWCRRNKTSFLWYQFDLYHKKQQL